MRKEQGGWRGRGGRGRAGRRERKIKEGWRRFREGEEGVVQKRHENEKEGVRFRETKDKTRKGRSRKGGVLFHVGLSNLGRSEQPKHCPHGPAHRQHNTPADGDSVAAKSCNKPTDVSTAASTSHHASSHTRTACTGHATPPPLHRRSAQRTGAQKRESETDITCVGTSVLENAARQCLRSRIGCAQCGFKHEHPHPWYPFCRNSACLHVPSQRMWFAFDFALCVVGDWVRSFRCLFAVSVAGFQFQSVRRREREE